MTDDNTTKMTPLSTTPNGKAITSTHTVKLPALHSRLARAANAPEADPMTRPNRIALMLDCSASMQGDKIEKLRDACTSFVQHCNMNDTSLAMDTFPRHHRHAEITLTCSNMLMTSVILSLKADGGTPMAATMQHVLTSVPATRCVMVSDGAPDSDTAAYESAQMYAEAQIPIDCVHIGHTQSGEEVMQRIAEITGGRYIKFSDISSFTGSFKYLTPAFYGMLTSGAITAEELGAKELK